MDIVLLLEKDHREIRSLLTRLRSTEKAKLRLFGELRALLEAHDAAEEEELYPRVARILEMKEEAETFLEEHQAARDLMDRLETVNPNGNAWDTLVADLSEVIETHLREEEELLFPQMRRLLPFEILERMGRDLEMAKAKELLKMAS
jgi:hemerythrin superfamily protein